MKTIWGYDVEEIKDILTVEEFNTMTANKYQGDMRIDSLIKSAQSAARNYCGWHISPAVDCEFESRLIDARFIMQGPDLLIQLPAKQINSVESVTIAGDVFTDFCIESAGVIRVFDVCLTDRKDLITVKYNAGTDDDGVKELVAHRVTHGLAQSYGVQTETTGSVSISYNASWVKESPNALPDDNREFLSTYKVQGVF